MYQSKILQIEDLTETQRFGIKGAQAENWLHQQAIPIPVLANHWLETKHESGQHLLVLRLGVSEFLVENLHDQMTALHRMNSTGVYIVPRADVSFRLSGVMINGLLAEICMLNFEEELIGHELVMTQVAGVSVILLKETAEQASYRLWCDASYKDYMLKTLSSLANRMEIEYSAKVLPI